MKPTKHRSLTNDLTHVKRGVARLHQLDLSARRWMGPDRVAIVWIGIGLMIVAVSVGVGLAALVASKVSQRREASLPQALAAMDQGHYARARRIARQLQAEGESAGNPQSAKKYTEAIELLESFPPSGASSDQLSNTATYLTGVALRKLHRFEEAREQLSLACRADPTSPLALAAGLEEAEILEQLGQTQSALVRYKQLIDQAGRPETYSNPWVSLGQLRHRLTAAHDRFVAAKQFPAAIELAAYVAPIMGRARAIQAQAQARRAWAEDLLEAADRLALPQAQAARDRAYRQFRRAGQEYARLAQLRYAQPELADDLWNSATNYLDGHGFRRAVSMFERYLEVELRRRRPDALVGLARALMALDRIDQAILSLEECIESYPKDPLVYEARRLASLAYAERGDLAQAKNLLSQNVHHQSLTPQSVQWRDSLFALGKIRYCEASVLEAESRLADLDLGEPDTARQATAELEQSFERFRESGRVLSEAVERYPDAPQSIEARYLLAQSHRHCARLLQWKHSLTKIEPVRATLRKQEQHDLAQALETYHQLHHLLTKKQAEAPLSTLESAILRNCYFGQGDALLSLGRYEEAIRVYSAAASRYQRRPESLEAFVQIADCYRRLDRPTEAQGTIEQAKVVLGRLQENSNFTDTTRYTRQEWDQTLEWLGTL